MLIAEQAKLKKGAKVNIKNISPDRDDFDKLIFGLIEKPEFRHIMSILESLGEFADVKEEYDKKNKQQEWIQIFSSQLYSLAFKSVDYSPEIGVNSVTCACLLLGVYHEAGDIVVAVHEKIFVKIVEKKGIAFKSLFDLVGKELMKQFAPAIEEIPKMNRN